MREDLQVSEQLADRVLGHKRFSNTQQQHMKLHYNNSTPTLDATNL